MQSSVSRKSQRQELEAARHVLSAVRKQSQKDAGAQLLMQLDHEVEMCVLPTLNVGHPTYINIISIILQGHTQGLPVVILLSS